MGPARLEAFSDGVMAIIITIMVLEMKVPRGDTIAALKPTAPVFISYILSFINIGIYWNNHHHLMNAIKHVNGAVLWANIHLLFWLSLIPFASGWMGKTIFTTIPVALYGVIVLMAGVAYYILTQMLIRLHGKDSTIGLAIGGDKKGILSVLVYAVGIGISFISSWLGILAYSFVAVMWFIPDKRIEKQLKPDQ